MRRTTLNPLYLWSYLIGGHWVRTLLRPIQPTYCFHHHLCTSNRSPYAYATAEGYIIPYGRLYRHLWFWGCIE